MSDTALAKNVSKNVLDALAPRFENIDRRFDLIGIKIDEGESRLTANIETRLSEVSRELQTKMFEMKSGLEDKINEGDHRLEVRIEQVQTKADLAISASRTSTGHELVLVNHDRRIRVIEDKINVLELLAQPKKDS